MTGSMRQKLEELKELRAQNYITEQEYAAARSNIFLDAGFDILPRTENASIRIHSLIPLYDMIIRFPAASVSTIN